MVTGPSHMLILCTRHFYQYRTAFFLCIFVHRQSVRACEGQEWSKEANNRSKVIFSITREEIQLPVKIGDKNLNLTQPRGKLLESVFHWSLWRLTLHPIYYYPTIPCELRCVKSWGIKRVSMIYHDISNPCHENFATTKDWLDQNNLISPQV